MDEITIIKPRRKLYLINLKELYRYRELFFMLAARDIKVRYKQTIFGVLWAVIKPFVTMIIFTIFFGEVVKVPSEGIPYAIFSYSGLLIWNYFSTSISTASDSMIANKTLVSKIYFPRIIITLSSTIVGLFDYVIGLIILLGIMAYYKFIPNIYIFFIIIIMFLTWMLASGVGFWLSALNVKYRDTRFLTAFLSGMLLFMTPVIYPISIVGRFKWLLMFNPMSGLVEAHRAMILGHQAVDLKMLGISVILTMVIFVSGIIYFNSVERNFADII